MEVVISMLIMGLVFAGIVTMYVQGAKRTEWSGYSLAAQAQAIAAMEQVRASAWDPNAITPVDQTTNGPMSSGATLDLPVAANGNSVWVSNYTTVSTITIATNPLTYVKMVRVDTAWPWRNQIFTNTLITYRAPD
ncbi:MAG: hypothetical protein JWQ71_1961 [Pedosphaera sp.]|nr:hypothetical protein [Pedosphaera sp.]